MARFFNSKVATSAVYGLGALTAALAFLYGEGVWTKRAVGTTTDRPPSPDGLYGADLGGTPLNVLFIGDSAAVGYGMKDVQHTPPALLGEGLAHVLDRPVFVRSRATVGAQSRDLTEQINAGIRPWPDVAVCVIGTNDVTHVRPYKKAAEELASAIQYLRAGGTKVIVGTTPDLGTIRMIPQPLRAISRASSRLLAEKQTVAALNAGARTVSLGDLLGELFHEHPDRMFGFDNFHPSEEGYANLVNVLLPPVVAAVREAEPMVSHEMTSVSKAAHEAVQNAGTEVTMAGKVASLLRRRR